MISLKKVESLKNEKLIMILLKIKYLGIINLINIFTLY